MLYFAYGSNLHPVRLQARVPSARVAGKGVLRGRRLKFHKRGKMDGSGKCDASMSAPENVVHGALFEIATAQWSDLCSIEGVGRGYELEDVLVETGERRLRALTLIAQEPFVDPALRPFDWYHALVVEGALFHRFPGPYLSSLEEVRSIPDPDAVRSFQHWQLVKRIRSGT